VFEVFLPPLRLLELPLLPFGVEDEHFDEDKKTTDDDEGVVVFDDDDDDFPFRRLTPLDVNVDDPTVDVRSLLLLVTVVLPLRKEERGGAGRLLLAAFVAI